MRLGSTFSRNESYLRIKQGGTMMENNEQLFERISDELNSKENGYMLILKDGNNVRIADSLNISSEDLATILLKISAVKVGFALAMDEAMTMFFSVDKDERFKSLITEYNDTEMSAEELYRLKHSLYEEFRKVWFKNLK